MSADECVQIIFVGGGVCNAWVNILVQCILAYLRDFKKTVV